MTIHNLCRSLASIALMFAFVQAQEVQTLRPGQPLEREIGSGQTHVFRLPLTAGQFVHFTVEQLSCDVTLTLTTPDGKSSVKANLGVAGLREALSEEATMSGDYQFTLQNASAPWLKGSYRLQAEVKATATAKDRQRIQAERGLIELATVSNPQQALEKFAPLLSLWRDIGDRYWEGVTLGAMASRYQQQQNWAKGEEHAEQAVTIMREAKMPTAEATYLQTLVVCQRNQQKIDQALATATQALTLARQNNQRNLEATLLGQLGDIAFFNKSEPEKAAAYYEQSIAIYQELDNVPGLAARYNVQGMVAQRLKKYEEAQKLYETALTMAQEQNAKSLEESISRNLGDFYREQNLLEKASGYYEQSLEISRTLETPNTELTALLSYSGMLWPAGQPDKAIQGYERALEIVQERKSKPQEATILRSLGQSYGIKKEYDKAAAYYEQAIRLYQELKDTASEAGSLRLYGLILRATNQNEKSFSVLERVLAIWRERNDKTGEGMTLVDIGISHLRLSSFEKSSECFEKALQLSAEGSLVTLDDRILTQVGRYFANLKEPNQVSELRDKLIAACQSKHYSRAESLVLLQTAFLSGDSQLQRKIIPLERATELARQNRNRSIEIDGLRYLSSIHEEMLDFEKSVKYTLRSLEISREVKDRVGEIMALLSLGAFYSNLGHYEQATQSFEQALAKAKEFRNQDVQFQAFMSLGWHYARIGSYDKVIAMHEQAISFFRQWKASHGEITQLTLLAKVYILKGEYEKSLELLQQARNRAVEVKDTSPRPNIPYYFGEAYRGLKKYELAIGHHQQAIQLTSPDSPMMSSNSYLGLMKDYEALNLPQSAIFWGKQAVNSIQGLREKMVNLDRDLQQSFLKSKEDIYRSLADLLIANGRLPEAEQVIRMLKDEEYFDYIRRDTKNGPKGEKASLTPEEAAAEKRYREIADQLAGIGAERSALLGKTERSADEEQRLAKLETDLTVASQVFQKFLDQLSTELSTRKAGDASVAQLNDSQAFMDDLREMGKGAVALYTVVSEDKFHVILTTSDLRKSYSYPIKAADLNRKVLAFRDVLQNPKLDPLPLAQELYKILVAPLAKDLQAAKAETLMWSLDGVLRYVPMAALHDGEKYLVERYRNVVFTAASKGRLKDDPSRNWRALGLGVTKAHGDKIPALPAVADEMRGIIKEAGSKSGVLPGAIKLDEQFTQEAMLTSLRGRPSVVHVASHFRFSPGNETNSALLLGDGNFLSLAQIKSLPNVFSGVELLTLSACNTAMGSGGSNSAANGKEIEGFGMLAQAQGAKAVVASLWPVADRSTKELMQEFYRLRETNNALKSEALRQAQRKLLRGELVMTVDLTQREIVHETNKATNQPLYKADPKKPYAHPYYWAPFILIGNWK